MEIGSFLELQFSKGLELYKEKENIARLNSGRAAIYHAVRILNCNTVWLPYYQCDTVRDFLHSKGITLRYYHIDNRFNPTDLEKGDGDAVLFVNYYGVMSNQRMAALANGYTNVVIDNCQGFFCKPIAGCMNVYSCRKFVGVPDGAYVIGDGAEQYTDEYEQSYSSDTSLFLLQRIEYGCEGKAYQSRSLNERRINTDDIMKMSPLTRAILDGTDYGLIQRKRRENFAYASSLFSSMNQIDPLRYYSDDTIPMVYPLVVEDDSLLGRLQASKHFQGHWWSYLCDELPDDSYEYWLSRYVIPITIDQRYGRDELDYLKTVVEK